ncbi:Eco57I restriction-modification methylase domain-containing protein, partial [Olleya sp. AH-315-F22]|nr:Eco57I restriction-modification methylase domain-containing protein [Olleya sp. AH-315-F22]
NRKDDNKLIALFKLISPEHLLKLPFANDSNSLDKRFYGELLHIIGLIETKEGSKKLIGRNKEGKRNTGSLLENAIIQLDSLDKISRLDKPSHFGTTQQERLFNVGLELSITWLNRILFLKLLEAQLITYHKGDKSYEFLSLNRIQNYDDLNSLFFQVLARQQSERNEDVKKAFEKVPYLNSSLFEPTEIEHATLFISNLRDDKPIPIYSSTVLKNEKGKKRTGELSALEYLFEFLNSYDFSSEGSEDIQEDNKSLINASVLGLIFEKINGYKDGSFFTPGFITMYMCRETIRKTVVQKFNENKNWNCKNIDSLYDKIEDRTEANDIINSLKICDPAVGSGHFLVSSLNEIIAIKNDLKILQDRDGKRLKEYQFEVVNDDLIITDDDGELFEYSPKNKESQRVQEAIFHEKQTIIENCLFGVDINPNSVKICRLRLWIELLKSAYYKNETELETLPNIDINIKCGNSLISRFDLDADLGKALKKSKWNIDSYRIAVDTYRNAQTKEQKHAMEKLINDIKSDFKSEISMNDPKVKRLTKLKGELFMMTQPKMFELSKKEKTQWNKKLKELTAKTSKLENEMEEIKNNKIYEEAFEWRFEFPEVLNEEGAFIGFDAIIGNPPYMLLQTLPKNEEAYLKNIFKTASYKGDTFGVFIELAYNLGMDKGIINVIVPYTWISIQQHFELRKLVLGTDLNYIIDLPQKVFENADIDTTIVQMTKGSALNANFLIGRAIDDTIIIDKTGNKEFCKQNEYWQINLNINENEIDILNKISNLSSTLESVFEVSQGYIPYRRSDLIKTYGNDKGNKIVDERLWHTKNPKSPEFKQEIQGRDLSRFKYVESFQFVKYGKHLAGYVDPKYFTSPRVLVMEVTRGNKYKLTAAFVKKELYNTPSIINIIHPDNNINDLLFLTGLLNSILLTWYHLKVHSKSQAKTSIPKILVREVRNIPFPKTDSIIKSQIADLAQKAIDSSNGEITNISLQIDQLVYKLYNLTAEEIKIVENANA